LGFEGKMEEKPIKRFDSLADFVVDDARRKWIVARYPENDWGRPGILVVSGQRSKRAEPVIEESAEESIEDSVQD